MSHKGFIIAVFFAVIAFHAIVNASSKFIRVNNEEGTKEKIVGGSSTFIYRHPYQVIVTNSTNMCGGTILTELHILTAAHCIYGYEEGHFVNSGTSTLKLTPGIMVKKTWIHPEYNEKTVVNDIAILELSSPLKFDESRQPALLPTEDVKERTNANVTGFGVEINGILVPSHQLKVARVQTWNHMLCKKVSNGRVSENQICTLGLPGTGTCMGDSGGPLTVGNTVIGVISFGFGKCASGLPQVFTNVYKYLPLIKEIISKN